MTETEFEEVYITQANVKNILSTLYVSKNRNADFGYLYPEKLNLILSGAELSALAAFRSFCESPEETLEFYNPSKFKRDSSRFVYTNDFAPAYHCNVHCEHLNKNYKNIEIPLEILNTKDPVWIESYRQFVKENIELLEEDPKRFLLRQQARFFLQNPPKEVVFSNSGHSLVHNYDLASLQNQINELMERAEAFRSTTDEARKLIASYGYGTHKRKEVLNGQKDTVIYIWHHEYKQPLKLLLQEYFRVKFNPYLKFSGRLLKQLNFHACKKCCDKH